jgi:hypothetical protein
MKEAQDRLEPEAALLLAVHATIAAADAFTIRFLGLRCASERHEDATELASRVKGCAGLDEAKGHLHRVLRSKYWVEYSDRDPRIDSMNSVCDHARKFIEFVAKTFTSV